jgi:hypothetical protein
MIKVRTRVNAIHPVTNKYAVGIVLAVNGYILTIQFADETISNFHISDVTIFD